MNLFALAGISCAISCLVLGVLALSFGRTTLHRILFAFNIAVAVWGLGLFMVGVADTVAASITGWKAAHLGGFFVGVLFYHMVCVLTGIERRKLLWLGYAQGIVFNILSFSTDKVFNKVRDSFGLLYNDVTPLLFVAIGFYLFYIVLSYVELTKFLKKTKGYKRTQTLYVIFGFMFGFLGGTSTFIPEFGIDFVYPFGNFGITFYCFVVSYAILRYRLMDIHVAIKKGMVYSLSAGILTTLFVLMILTMTRFLSDMAGVNSFRITAVAAFVIAISFHPLRDRVQRLVDKKFYKRTYDYYSTIQQVSSTLASTFSKENVLKFIGNILYEVLGLETVTVLAYMPADGSFEKAYRISGESSLQPDKGNGDNPLPVLHKDSEAVKILSMTKEIIIKDELPLFEDLYGKATEEALSSDLEKFEAGAMMPVFLDGKLSYIIMLGEKLSGDMFTTEDIKLLSTIADQMSIALKNAEFYAGKMKTERLASIGMMSATFAHEIRNPLTSLKTFAQLMPEKYNDKEFRTTFSKIVEGEIEKIDTLIGDLLDFSSDKKSSRVNDFNIVELVDETLEYIIGKVGTQAEVIEVFRLYHDNVIDMAGDAAKLKQAFGIIIMNGFQAMHGTGKLKIEVKRNGGSIDVDVTDTGEGIPHEDISKIFDPFVTTKEMGVGLGLAITKRIIEDHEGKIYVRSRVSEGSTFTITLPMKK